MKSHVVWLCVTILALFAGMQFSRPPVVKEVPKEAVKTVEKRVEVPAEIPDEYVQAKALVDAYVDAKLAKGDEILTGVSGIFVKVSIPDSDKLGISSKELQDTIELSLRKNGIPIDDTAPLFLGFKVEGIWDAKEITFNYSITLELREAATVRRPNKFVDRIVSVWSNGYVGFAGRQVVGKSISDAADKLVVSFSNSYLKMNPKETPSK